MSHLRHPNPNFTGFAFDGDSLFFRVEEAFP